VSRFVKKGDVLKMELNPNGADGPVSGYCRVVWTKNLTQPSAFQTDAGVEFTKFNAEAVDRLLATVSPV
jgi:hypothetical protein